MVFTWESMETCSAVCQKRPRIGKVLTAKCTLLTIDLDTKRPPLCCDRWFATIPKCMR